jgi:hypothetical protein
LKTSDFDVVKLAKRAVIKQLEFYNKMMGIKEAAKPVVYCEVSNCARKECHFTNRCQASVVREKVCAVEYGEHDNGPWTPTPDGKSISSDDFAHDVILEISGNFANDAQRFKYAQNLAIKLNAVVEKS